MAASTWDVTSKQPTVSADPNPFAGGEGSKSALVDPTKLPSFTAAQYGTSPELDWMLKGKGFSPGTLANMNATAMEAPAAAGTQEMANVKRSLANNGLGYNPAGAGYEANVAKRTGEAQTANRNAVALGNAQLGEQQKQFGITQQTQIGQGNMAAANSAAMAQWNAIFQTMQQNQAVRFGTQQSVAGMQ